MHPVKSILSGAAASCALLCAVSPALAGEAAANEAAEHGPTNLSDPTVEVANDGPAYSTVNASASKYGRAPERPPNRPSATATPVSSEQAVDQRPYVNVVDTCVPAGALKQSRERRGEPACRPMRLIAPVADDDI